MHTPPLKVLGVFCLALGLTACSQSGAGSTLTVGSDARPVAPNSKAASTTVYVLGKGQSDDYVAVFAHGGAKFLRSISTGGSIQPFAVSAKGILFAQIANDGRKPFALDVYAKQGNKLIQTVPQNQQFYLMTVDVNGNLFAACAEQRVCEYAYNRKKGVRRNVVRAIQFKGAAGISALTTDRSGDVAIATGAGVFVYPPNAKTPSWAIANPNLATIAMAFDSSGNLYVGTGASNARVEVFAPGSSKPTRTIVDSDGPATDGLAIDGADNLYVLTGDCLRSCTTQPAVAVYPPGANRPSYTITDGLVMGVLNMAVTSNGELYVCNEGDSVVAYAGGSAKPQRYITNKAITPYQVGVDQ